MKKILLFILSAAAVMIIARRMDTGKIMTPEITAPYFSGAALNGFHKGWKFNAGEVDSLKKICSVTDVSIRRDLVNSYRFSEKEYSTKLYSLNQPGLVYVISFASAIFPFTGQIGALRLLQLCVHILFSFFILMLLKNTRQKIIFFFLYMINPAIIYLTVLPFYYFWQVTGSFIILILLLRKKTFPVYSLFITSIILAGLYHIRITTLPLSLLIIFTGFVNASPAQRLGGIILFAFCISMMQPVFLSKHPGHVMYSSLGAYPGSMVSAFSDSVSFADYNRDTHHQYSYSSTPGMFDAEVIMGESHWGMDQFKTFAIHHPLIIIRNAALNFFESFSAGYFTRSMLLTCVSAVAGLIFFVLLCIRKKWKSIILITVSVISYVFYLAPVPVYLYGTYVLLVYVLIDLTEDYLTTFSK